MQETVDLGHWLYVHLHFRGAEVTYYGHSTTGVATGTADHVDER
ncbi:hypothetical protein [Streptomyces collinus]